MATDSEYTALLSQYQMAISDVHALKERQKRDILTWNAYKNRNEILYKNMEELCQNILSKSKKEQNLSKVSGWQAEDLSELIKRSITTFNEILSNLSATCRANQRVAEDRGKDIEELKAQQAALELALVKCGLSEENIRQILDSPGNREAMEKALATQPSYIKQGIENGGIVAQTLEVVDEPKDHLEDDFLQEAFDEVDREQETASMDMQELTSPKPTEKPASVKGSEVRKVMQERAAQIATASYRNVEFTETQLQKKEWICLQTIVETGLSIQKEVIALIQAEKNTNKLSESTVVNTIKHLTGMAILETVTVKVNGKTLFVRPTEFGNALYCRHFQKKPEDIKENLWGRLVREHDNLEHGYGIYLLASQIRNTEIFADVQMFGVKAIELSQSKKGSKYKPDIVCTSDDGSVMYIEYELANHKHLNFNEKCSKMLSVTDTLNFVVNSRQTVEVMIPKIKKWILEYGQNRLKGVIIRMTTSGDVDENHDLRKDDNWDYVWYPHKGIEPKINIQSGTRKGGTKNVSPA